MREDLLVPPRRFGQLLTEARLREGTDLEEFASRSDYTVGELADFEAGHRLLDEGIIETIAELYEVDCGPIVPQRVELTIDIDDKRLSAAGQALKLDSDARDHILDRYLALVYLLRNKTPGTEVPLRAEDLAILAASLAERAELVEELLLESMATDEILGIAGWLRTHLWVPRAGALVGVVSVGTLVLISDGTEALPDSITSTIDDGLFDSASSLPLLGQVLENTSTSSSSTSLPESSTTTFATSTSESTSTSAASTTSLETTTSMATTTSSSTTSSTTSEPTVVSNSPESVGAAAEALLPFNWQTALPGWNVVYLGSRSGYRGLTFPYEKRIEMYVRDGDTGQSLAGILAHELGHAIDVTHFNDSDRSVWLNARGQSGAQWWPDAYASDFETGAGDFAEAFAYWAIRDPNSSRLAGTPNASQLATLESLLSGVPL